MKESPATDVPLIVLRLSAFHLDQAGYPARFSGSRGESPSPTAALYNSGCFIHMSHTLNTAVSFGPTEAQITDSLLDDGSNLPKYYFGDLPADVMQEIVDEMAASQPDQDIEEVDHWLNCHNVEATIPDWYDRVASFKAER